ncbi:MAG: Ig-like domain-containing protein, partial [Spirochaetia bacterium]|nr:Ig-like domain-containing protein [Spirochaetia bacterium]
MEIQGIIFMNTESYTKCEYFNPCPPDGAKTKKKLIQLFILAVFSVFSFVNCNITCSLDTNVPIPGQVSVSNKYHIGGIAEGLNSGGVLVLQNNGADSLSITGSGTGNDAFTFSSTMNSGDTFSITVISQPSGLLCNISSNLGTVGTTDINFIHARCAANGPIVATSLPSLTNAKSTATINYTVTYSGASTVNLTAANIALNTTGTATCSVAVTNGTTTTPTVTLTNCTGDGTIGITVAANTATDASGIINSASAPGTTFNVDNTVPTVLISSTATNPTNLATIPMTATFSESVTGFAVGSIALTNGTAGSFVAVSGTTYTFNVTPTADGAITVNIAAGSALDLAGNNSTAATQFGITSDRTAPTVAVSAPSATLTNSAGTVNYTVTYSGANTINLLVSGITLNTTGTATCAKSIINGNTATPTVALTNCTGDGTIGITVAASTASDLAGNTNLVSAASTAFNVDNTVPTVLISSTAANPTNLATIPMTATFSESVTGFAVGSIALTNGTAGTFVAVSGTTYTFNITPTADGAITVNIAAGSALDLAGNNSAAATQFGITSDRTAPTITSFTSTTASGSYGPTAAINVTINFSEPVTLAGGTLNLTLNNGISTVVSIPA